MSGSEAYRLTLPSSLLRRLAPALVLACLSALCAFAPAYARGIAEIYPQAKGFFPQADRFGELTGKPPAAPVYRGDALLGYVFLTNDVLKIPAYSGHPINTLVGFDVSGRITGIEIVQHEEPILLVGVSEERLRKFVGQYRGKSVFDRIVVGAPRKGYVNIDTISGATITVMVENATVMRSARRVADSRGLTPRGSPAGAPAVAASSDDETASVYPADEPIWVALWRQRAFEITVLGLGLFFLTLVLIFQDWLARRPKLLLYVRDGYLVFTLLFLGWYALAQLSVVNVLTFVHAVVHEFRWESFLIDPMIFILWSFVAVTLLLWGRGVYCGWLCPYGALQELTQQIARKLRVRQFEFPEVVHERMWALKYVVLIVLFGISLQSLGDAERYAEIEPFKTTFALRFHREWWYAVYAIGLVLISAFNRKFFCKYMCPLGAALTIPARHRIFDWLRRYKECGKPCQVCYGECEVRAVRQTGEINANECHYCLDCQVTYYNPYKCPPMVERRKRRERVPRAREAVRGMEHLIGPSGLDEIAARVEPSKQDRGNT